MNEKKSLVKPFGTFGKTLVLLLFLVHEGVKGACPYSRTSEKDTIPNDGIHNKLRGEYDSSINQDRISQNNISSFFKETKKKRLLQSEGSVTKNVTKNMLLAIKEDIIGLANSINDAGARGHFFGGIVRLAAHDFMDYDQTDINEPGGSDGCLDFDDVINAGLPDLWCDDDIACPFRLLYDSFYSDTMSKADFWIASATQVIEITSPQNNPLVLPFRWGRVDSDICPSSSSRLPKETGCIDVEACFIDRMGLSWTDATALMGGHTLGRGSADFSGHEGTWVDTDGESAIFDKRFYTELTRRAWFPTVVKAGIDWKWGRGDRNVMMLNTDICLYFDIPDGNNQRCCTDTGPGCEGVELCPYASSVRPEAFVAVDSFRSGMRDDNDNFFAAFTKAWVAATENGHSNLFEVLDTCDKSSPPCVEYDPFEYRFESNHSWGPKVSFSSSLVFVLLVAIISLF